MTLDLEMISCYNTKITGSKRKNVKLGVGTVVAHVTAPVGGSGFVSIQAPPKHPWPVHLPRSWAH